MSAPERLLPKGPTNPPGRFSNRALSPTLPLPFMNRKLLLPLLSLLATVCASLAADTSGPIGAHGTIGCLANPKTVSRLEITRPGIYENYRVDAQGRGGN